MLREFEAVRAKVKTSKLWAFMYPRKPRASKGRVGGKENGSEKNEEKEGRGGGEGKRAEDGLHVAYCNPFLSGRVASLAKSHTNAFIPLERITVQTPKTISSANLFSVMSLIQNSR